MSIRLFRPFYQVVANALEDGSREIGTRGAELLQKLSERYDFDDPDTRIPFADVYQLLDAATEDTGDRCLGLHAAELVEPGDLDVVYYVASCSADFGQAVGTLARYFSLVNETAVASLQVQGERALWTFGTAEGVPGHQAATDYVLATTMLSSRRLLQIPDAVPLEVHFAYPLPEDTSEHERIFGAPLYFEAADNCMIFPAMALPLPLPGADSNLCAILQSHADRLLEELPSADRFTDRVRELLVGELRGGNPNIDNIAHKLTTSPSTLRRRLADEGTTHRELLDDVRRRLALRYLGQNELILSEIAFLLGFSHENAFRKAFRRWTGKSPAEFRQRGPLKP